MPGKTSHVKGRPVLIAILVLLPLALAACGGSGPGSQGSATTPSGTRSSKPLWTLGSINDLTGVASNGGEAQQTALNFFVDQTNRAGGLAGHLLHVEYCDTQSTPNGGANCARRLSSVNTHVVLLSSALPSTLGAVPQLSDMLGVSILPVLYPKVGTEVFQVSSAEKAVVAPMLAAAKAQHLHTIGVLYTADASGTAQLGAAQENAPSYGLTVVDKAFTPGTPDVTTQLLQLKSAGAQVLFVASIGANTGAALTSYHSLGLTLPVVLGQQAVSNTFLRGLPYPVPKKLYGISSMVVNDNDRGLTAAQKAAWSAYRREFKASVREPLDSPASTAYHAACVASAALKATDGGTAAQMSSYLSANPVTCLGGQVRFDQVPGFNVVSGVPAALTQAGPTVADGWGPVRNPL